MHIDNSAIRRWLEERMEGSRNRVELTREEQIRIFTRLTDAVTFEEINVDGARRSFRITLTVQ